MILIDCTQAAHVTARASPATRLLSALITCLFFSCSVMPKTAADEGASQPAFQKPTATEVFNLRSKCAALGEKIMEENTIAIGLAQSQTSHYNPKTNRCYVDLSVRQENLSQVGEYSMRQLYDGQTRQLLAFCGEQGGKQNGVTFDGTPLGSDGFTDACRHIDDLMADDRKQ